MAVDNTKLPNDPMEAAYRRCVEQQAPDEQIDRNSFFAGFVAAQRVQQSEDVLPYQDKDSRPFDEEAAKGNGFEIYQPQRKEQANDDAEVRIGMHRYEGKHTFGDETHSSITIGLDYPGDWTDNDLLAWLRKRGIK